MDILSPSQFFEIQIHFKHIPHSQSERWYKYLLSLRKGIVFYCNSLEDPSIAVMGRIGKIPILGKLLIIEGELINENVSNENITEFYKELIQLPYIGIIIDSNVIYSIEYEIGVRRAGFTRPLGFFLCPLTIMVDLTTPVEYNTQWKKNFKKAIHAELIFIEVEDPQLPDLETFSEIFNKMATKKDIGLHVNPDELSTLVDGNTWRLFFVKSKEGEILAGNILYVNKNFSYLHLVANSERSRQTGASVFAIQKMLDKITSEGIQIFDFARIPPRADAMDGIYQFKQSIKGKKIQYNGEWAFYKNTLVEYLYFLIRKYYYKQLRY